MDGKRSSAESEEQSKQKRKAETVPFRKLFAFADCADITLMVVGSVGAMNLLQERVVAPLRVLLD
ncbi:hypothetical protein DEO72_LG2g4020 [Vigna unguiculata]|uniref:Uncharacterized protein n=1 Tax=Vigna unguiculata TaxID=3917 RepID=A0A4D6L590_VIGUN|nr:hypothetical protein DEO72_LG2g4020 [Vigna unguiculata]